MPTLTRPGAASPPKPRRAAPLPPCTCMPSCVALTSTLVTWRFVPLPLHFRLICAEPGVALGHRWRARSVWATRHLLSNRSQVHSHLRSQLPSARLAWAQQRPPPWPSMRQPSRWRRMGMRSRAQQQERPHAPCRRRSLHHLPGPHLPQRCGTASSLACTPLLPAVLLHLRPQQPLRLPLLAARRSSCDWAACMQLKSKGLPLLARARRPRSSSRAQTRRRPR